MDFDFLRKTQPKAIKTIENGFKKNRLSQLYLFEGERGTPKKAAALYLASLLMCEEHRGCGKCEECLRLEEGIHPRLFTVSPQGNVIRKEQISDLEREFNLSSSEKGIRLFIVDGIDKVTTAAGNSLLKFLEELKEDCYGVLLTENISGVLSTIKSRSQIIGFGKIGKETLREIYMSKGIDSEFAGILGTLTDDPKEGLELMKNEDIRKIILLVKKINQSFFENYSPITVMNEDGGFLLASGDKSLHRIFLDLLITITDDRLYYLSGKKERMIFSETIEEMSEYGIDIGKIGYDETLRQLETMIGFRERLAYNVNLELMYMDLFIMCEV